MRIVHFSDWHASVRRLPSGDIYVCSGDMMADYPLWKIEWPGSVSHNLTWDPVSQGSIPEGAYLVGSETDKKRSESYQLQWQFANPARREMNIPEDAPVIVVRGNHDHAHLADWFGGDVWEITDDPTRTTTLFGLKFGGCRGIEMINGSFSDELFEPEMNDRVMKIPMDVDVLVTHPPPKGILSSRWGSPALAAYVQKRMLLSKMKAHLFGHIHSERAVVEHGGCIFSNASEGVQVIDL